MPSHWSSIGFPEDGEAVFDLYGDLAIEQGRHFNTLGNSYIHWECGQGAEVWMQRFDHDSVALNPHFAGKTSTQLQLTTKLRRPDEPPLDGAYEGEVKVMLGNVPVEITVVFDTPDYLLHTSLKLPGPATVQLTAFAHNLSVYLNEQAYLQQQAGDRKLSPFSFFSDKMNRSSCASFGGVIEACTLLTNPITNSQFWWARVRTLIGEVDVVADPGDVPLGTARQNIIYGNFWLSGRLLTP